MRARVTTVGAQGVVLERGPICVPGRESVPCVAARTVDTPARTGSNIAGAALPPAPLMPPKCAIDALPLPCLKLKKSMTDAGVEISIVNLRRCEASEHEWSDGGEYDDEYAECDE